MSMDQEYYSVAQVAKRLNIQERRVREAIRRGDLNAHRLSAGERGDYRIGESDLRDWLRRTATNPGRTDDLIEIPA